MNLYGYTEEEAEAILARKRNGENYRKTPEYKSYWDRVNTRKQAIQSQDRWQMNVLALAALVAEESWDISQLCLEDTLFDMVAEWLVEDEDEYAAAHPEEFEEPEYREDENDAYDRMREQEYMYSLYEEAK